MKLCILVDATNFSEKHTLDFFRRNNFALKMKAA
jgi:hypothetical protein